ncbi:hypothetical protein [Oceanicoccus sp. KOV_DT_Chl]|uniref:hypothetical protein n=1 Tax=Oceanicoccus sp. KOV_DT_Chl TaxID=1904639 RepID=UPI0011AEE4FB|nr:hypothetical protein [Oceanicoccus sp. KOV_DT_Chl]
MLKSPLALIGLLFLSIISNAAIIPVSITTTGSFSSDMPNFVGETSSGTGSGYYDSVSGLLEYDFQATSTSDVELYQFTLFGSSSIDTFAGTGSFITTDCTVQLDLYGFGVCEYNPIGVSSPIYPISSSAIDEQGNGVMLTSVTRYTFLDGSPIPAPYSMDINFTYNVVSIPVPAAAWLFSSALIGLVGTKRKN